MQTSLYRWILILTILSNKDTVQSENELHLLGLFPMTGSWPGGQGQRPAIEIGIQHVNSDPTILPNYTLVLEPGNADGADTWCNGGRGTDVMYRELYDTSTTKIMVLGAGCSIVTEPTAQASHLWNLLQLSYSSASPKLSDRSLFPKFFRVFPTEKVLNVVKFDMLKHFGWTKVGTLHQTVDLFSLAMADFLYHAKDNEIDVLTSESFSNDSTVQVSNLKKQGARIIIGNFYENKARQVFCHAYKEGMYGAKYVWIITGWYSSDWWRKQDGSHDCTLADMEEAVRGYFTTDALPLSLSSIPGVSNRTTSQFLEEYSNYVGGNVESLSGYQEAPYGYDSVWTIALMLQQAEQRLQSMSPAKSLADFNYNDTEMAEMFFRIMSHTNFEGVSGPVLFTDTGDRQGLMQVEQNQNGTEVRVGIYDPSSSADMKITWSDNPTIRWQGGKPPADREQILEKHQTISFSLFISMTTLSAMGILLAIGFLWFNLRYRHHRFIKMSSPYMNNLILFGCILAYVSIILSGVDTGLVSDATYLLIQKVNSWVLAISFSLAFGAMFSKTWRVHKIFTNKKLEKRVIKDTQLFGMVGILVLVDIFVLTLWEVIDPLTLVKILGSQQEDPTDSDIVLIPIWITCDSRKAIYWLGALYAVKGILLIFGAFLAWETRNVTVVALNDSKYIGTSVYNVVILSFVGVAISLIMKHQVDASYVLISMFIFFATTLTQCVVFVPKIKGRNEVQPSGTMLTATWKDRSDSQKAKTDKDKKICEMTDEIQRLKERQTVYEDRIHELETLLERHDKNGDSSIVEVHRTEAETTNKVNATLPAIEETDAKMNLKDVESS
ncbi:gamma-aminobutyric acid type B receptor subunit 2-like [Ptychodera flava]|uniref:gamma-aminobutyric acid type B receptor subunit 2-like n=1 Tax=Ptychodera flava TaxID=63121 RepID=UPI00396A986C